MGHVAYSIDRLARAVRGHPRLLGDRAAPRAAPARARSRRRERGDRRGRGRGVRADGAPARVLVLGRDDALGRAARAGGRGDERHRHRLAAHRPPARGGPAGAARAVPEVPGRAAGGVQGRSRHRARVRRARRGQRAAERDLGPRGRRVQHARRRAGANPAAAGAERDDRHHHHPHRGGENASAGRDQRAPDRARARELAHGRVDDGQRRARAAGCTCSASRWPCRSAST